MSRGLRNNNPGNIRHDGVTWKGEVKGSDQSFKTFSSMKWGVRAVFHLLNNYQSKYYLRTIEQMIHRWAPDNENDTENYISSVSKWSGVPSTVNITTTNGDIMQSVVRSMIRMECGVELPMSDIYMGWELFVKNKK